MSLSPRLRARAGALVLAIAAALPGAVAAQSAPRDHTGVWWNAAESGWGVFTVDFGNTIAPTWYTYDEDGEAVWFIVAGAVPQADGSYVGDVYRFTGVPFAQIAGNAADPGTKLGTATFRFTGEDQLAMTYTIGTVTQVKQLTRFDFGQQDVVCHAGDGGSRAAATNYSDLWWNPAQNGWGLTFTHVGDNLYVTWYTYGEDGEAIWFLGHTSRQADGSFTGALYRGTTGTPFLQINGAPPSQGPAEVGTATLVFSDGQTADFTYTVEDVTQTQPVQRFVAGSNPPVCQTVTELPPDPRTLCLPELHVGDKWDDRVLKRLANGNYTYWAGAKREVDPLAPFQSQQAFVVETRAAIGTTNIAPSKTYFVQDADGRILLGEETFDTSTGAKTNTLVLTPPLETPRRLVEDEVVTVATDIAGTGYAGEFTHTFKLTGIETVTGPAGTFQGSCKVQVTVSAVEVAGSTTKTTTRTGHAWWHPQFGEVRGEYTETVKTEVGSADPTTTVDVYRVDLLRATIDGVSTE